MVELKNNMKEKFVKALDNDLNTSLAITAVYDVLKAKYNDATKRALLNDFDAVLSLELVQTADKRRAEKEAEEKAAREQAMQDPFVAEILTLIDQRAAAKKAKDFALADAIRGELLEKGIVLEDTREGVKWKRV